MTLSVIYEGAFGASHCTENHVARSLRDLGAEVLCLETGTFALDELDRHIIESKPDLFLLTRPWGRTPSVNRDYLQVLSDCGIVTAGFHLDRFFGLPERESWFATDPLFACEHLFTTDGAHEAEWITAGINHHWLRAGVLKAECYDAEPDREKWPQQVAFVGSYGYHAEWPHRPALIDHLAEWYGERFVLIPGNGNPALRGHDLNVMYATIPVTVGDSCFVTPEGRYTSDRVYEAWGRGGFLIHPRVESLIDELGPYPGQDWRVGEWDVLKDCIDGWLGDLYAHDETRKHIARTVRSSCTYTDRMRELLTVCGLVHRLEEVAA